MSKLFFLCVFFIYILTLGLIYYKNVADDERDLKQFYCANNQVLINKVRKIYDDKVATDRENEELRRAIREDKDSSFDWHQDISSTLPIITLKRLYEERNTVH